MPGGSTVAPFLAVIRLLLGDCNKLFRKEVYIGACGYALGAKVSSVIDMLGALLEGAGRLGF